MQQNRSVFIAKNKLLDGLCSLIIISKYDNIDRFFDLDFEHVFIFNLD